MTTFTFQNQLIESNRGHYQAKRCTVKAKSRNITSNICIKCDSFKNGSHLRESLSNKKTWRESGDGIFGWQPFRDIDDPYEIVGSVISHMCQGANLYWGRSSTPTQVGLTTILLPMRKFIHQDIRFETPS